MATMSAKKAGVRQTPSASLSTAPGASIDMDYYLSEGLEGVEHQKYRSTRMLTSAIESKAAELRPGNWKGGEYMVLTS